MNRLQRPLILIFLFLWVIVFLIPATQADEKPSDSKFVSLFNGIDLEGWDGDPRFWCVKDGAIVGETTKENATENNTFLIHRGGPFDDFELRLSYKVVGYNSGVQYRSVDQGKWMVAGYQCDFEAQWHKSGDKADAKLIDKFSGMFFEENGRYFLAQRGEAVIVRADPENPAKTKIEKFGSLGDAAELESHIKRDDWNELVVLANGNHFVHVINGHVMAIGIDEDNAKRRSSGLFAFQLHSGPPMQIQLKDIRVRQLVKPSRQSISRPKKKVTNHDYRAAYEQYALRHAGDPVNGRKLFGDAKRTQCAICHRVAGKGGEVGVDLSNIGGKFDRPHLIESLLEPSRQIVEGYRTTCVETTGGKVLCGILKQQSQQQITLADAAGKLHVIERDDIEELSENSVSIMPEGLAKELSLEEFADLIAYLENLRTGGTKTAGDLAAGPISLPEEFEIQPVVTGLDGVVALDVLPDGRVLICEQPGRVRVVHEGKLLEEPFVTLPVEAYWERGVIGVTHDPDFPQQPYIYVCWVAKSPYPHHRVSRFTMQGNSALPGSEKLLLKGDDQNTMGGSDPAGHQGGGLHFGHDGKLYIGIGEQTSGSPSQNLDTFLGKILRINSDGSIPEDNPFLEQTEGKYGAIWARGARNPFSFAFRDRDGLMLINDVGGVSEEINIGRAGANYGWPVVQHGDEKEYSSEDFDGPIHWYKESSINGCDFCTTTTNWPKKWHGRYFFADYVQGWIHTLDPDHPKDVNTFLEGMRRPVDMQFAPDGSLYVLLRNAWVMDDKFQNGTGSLFRIHMRDQEIPLSIDVWYGLRQQFGQNGNPQRWVNILGRLNGYRDTTKLEYSLNGGEKQKLTIGPNTTRLANDGDFNVEIDRSDLRPGENTVVIFASDQLNGTTNVTVTLDYAAGKSCPLPLHVDWSKAESIQDVAEVVDGLWKLTPEGIRVVEPYYDRVLAIGDASWTDYEVTVPVTFHSIRRPGPTDGGRNVVHAALAVRWPGHDTGPSATQPRTKWYPLGATAEFMIQDHPAPCRWRIIVDGKKEDFHAKDTLKITFGKQYILKHRVESHGGVKTIYRAKIWESDQPEPKEWAVTGEEDNDVAAGGALLLAHYSDLTFGNVTVRPIDVELGPQSGDVYREYSLHNGGDDWRVTDPNATAKRAQAHLPNPILQLTIDDLEHAIRAEVVLDRWGGHAGTKDKQIRFNDKGWITLPELSTTPEGSEPEQFYSQDNPIVSVSLGDLKEGLNTVEGGIGPGNAGHWWGQWGMYSAILRVYYDPEKKKHSLGEITSPVAHATLGENPKIKLACDENAQRIDLLAWYDGYDEDGNGLFAEWHKTRFQPLRGEPAVLRNHVGTITPSDGHELTWQTQWVPDQQSAAIKLVARIHSKDGLIYVTDAVDGLSLHREGWSVKQYRSTDIPPHFGVRVDETKSCQIPISAADDLSKATEAVLHYRTWEASDDHHDPFQLNGHKHANEGHNHHYDYDLLPIPVNELRSGDNTFTIHSDTEHHMLEVLWPGPAITVRFRTE